MKLTKYKILMLIIAMGGFIYQSIDFYEKHIISIHNLFLDIIEFDYSFLGFYISIIGIFIFLLVFLGYIIKKALRIQKPNRDAIDYWSENFLPEHMLINSADKHEKKMKTYKIFNIALYIIIGGFLITVIYNLFF